MALQVVIDENAGIVVHSRDRGASGLSTGVEVVRYEGLRAI